MFGYITVLILLVVLLVHDSGGQIKCYNGNDCPLADGPVTVTGANNSSTKQICTNSYCICSQNKYMDFKEQICKDREEFAMENNITEYKGNPGKYCFKKEDCIDGLVCLNTVCYCPGGCIYRPEDLMCDCGLDYSAGGLLVVAVVLGIANSFCWFKVFRKTKQGILGDSGGRVYSTNPTPVKYPVAPYPPDSNYYMPPVDASYGEPPDGRMSATSSTFNSRKTSPNSLIVPPHYYSQAPAVVGQSGSVNDGVTLKVPRAA